MSIFQNKRPVIISEIKFASPTRGPIYNGDMDHLQIAAGYLESGASALSVLTASTFKGDIRYLQEVRGHFPHSLLLMKDFIHSEAQILQGKEMGASAILLIAADLSEEQLKRLYDYALSLSLTPLIEIHHPDELENVLKLNPSLIGINNRDLKTGKINLDISRHLIKSIPDQVKVICESGIQYASEIKEMETLGFDGFLMGTAFMQANNPGLVLQKMIGAYHHEN
jgi:indole-3-glycerol phosphate synthase